MRNKMIILTELKNEEGFTLVELLSAITILGIVLPLFIGFIVSNSKMIELNTIQTEAISVREEIREWMSYKAQSQDIADLNPYVLATTGHQPDPITLTDQEEKLRASHLILDKSGIQKDTLGKAKYGEQVPADKLVDDDGNIITSSPTRQQTRQVVYLSSGFALPKLNLSAEKKRYVGMYVGEGALRFKVDYAVLVEAAPKAIKKGATATVADNQDSGILVTLRIYNSKTGKELTNTQFHWGADD
ncbi:type II secretion system protein [Pseudolactococcus plantarum]|nr:prepilin-type N-terminal cleavage/methylation domain-containing protein [Lactococcus plantarum]HCN75393.1 prepilin-type N-terminal cleavage/methylation domain-containing protein [Lactococcus sp.]